MFHSAILSKLTTVPTTADKIFIVAINSLVISFSSLAVSRLDLFFRRQWIPSDLEDEADEADASNTAVVDQST